MIQQDKRLKKVTGCNYSSPEAKFNDFSSHDIGLVAYLLCEGFELSKLDKTQKSKVLFFIKREGKLNRSVKDYWSSRTSVDAQSYFEQLKRLKNQIFSSD